jgi:DNA-3-methyladenine glycosylase I
VLDLRDAGHPFETWVWGFVQGCPIQSAWKRQEDVPVETPLSTAISRALKASSFQFVGPTTTYAWMQAVGLVNDHVRSCFRHDEVARLGRARQHERAAVVRASTIPH